MALLLTLVLHITLQKKNALLLLQFPGQSPAKPQKLLLDCACAASATAPRANHAAYSSKLLLCPKLAQLTWKHLDMCCMTLTGLLPLERMSSRSALDTK